MNIKELLRQHGKSVALVFSKNGIQANAFNPSEVITAIAGDPYLIDAIAEEIDRTGFTGIDGQSEGSKAKDTLDAILATILTGAGAYFGNKVSKGGTVNIPGIYAAPQQKQPNYFLIAAVAVVVILIALIISKKS